MKFIAIFFLIAAASAQNPVPSEFLAQVFREEGTVQNPQPIFLALGVMINQRHIITVASAVNTTQREQLRVHLQSETFRDSPDIRTVIEMIIHDHFATDQRANNIAILRIPYSVLTSVTTRPRMLGTLTPRVCRSFIIPGWTGGVSTREVTVTIIGCQTNTPLCSTRFPLGDNITGCTGALGSPVICENSNYVDGINIDEMNCGNMIAPLEAQMSFLSIHTHANWILYHSDANINSKVSVILVLLGVVFGKILM